MQKMLAKINESMFLSFRGIPRDFKIIKKEIILDVHRGLARLKNDEQNEDSTTKIARQLSDLAIEEMTSIDFSKDIRSNYRTHEDQMRDIVYIKKMWKAICGNAHLFKDKVLQTKITFFHLRFPFNVRCTFF